MRQVRRVALAFLLHFVAAPAFSLTVADDFANSLNLEGPAQRVISLSPHLTEMMYAIGAGQRMVATVRGSDYPAAANVLPEVGDAAGLDFERVVALQADLILAWGSGNRAVDIDRLRVLGFRVLVLEPKRLEDIPRHLRLLGELTGTREPAESVARQFDDRLQALRQRHARRTRIRVLFEIWHKPLFTINGEHIISRVLEVCAAENIFSGLPRLATEISLEQVLLVDPDAIVVGSEAEDAGVKPWMDISYLKAVRSNSVFTVSADLITRQTPRILDAAERVCVGLDKARR